ncbi:MAG: DUF695 domain-containing protein [Phycisphaeraceae bacterium]|nr:DUF695 domain-containing protein [Phycisphaeraceae bacterium]
MSKHEPNARIYQRVLSGKPAIVEIEEHCIDAAKREGLNSCVLASARFADQDADGLPAPGALEQLQLLDEHVAAAADQCNAVLAAIVTSDGRRTWILYGSNSETLLRAVAAGAKAGGPMRAGIGLGAQVGIVVRSENDPGWKQFSAALPTAEEIRWNEDLAVIEQLEEYGDDHSVPRPIEHMAFLPTEEARMEFMQWVRSNGYEMIMETGRREARGWPAEFAIDSVIDIDEIFEQTCAITVEAERLGGTYDGWQTRAVEKGAGGDDAM